MLQYKIFFQTYLINIIKKVIIRNGSKFVYVLVVCRVQYPSILRRKPAELSKHQSELPGLKEGKDDGFPTTGHCRLLVGCDWNVTAQLEKTPIPHLTDFFSCCSKMKPEFWLLKEVITLHRTQTESGAFSVILPCEITV